MFCPGIFFVPVSGQSSFPCHISIESYVLAIFLYLAKAFDTVDHAILLFRMKRTGIRGAVLNLIKSYLLDRKQFVYINGSSGFLKDILYGVPQGGVLGPQLFLIYINDIGMLDLTCMPNLFDDDTLLYYIDKDPLVNALNGQLDLNKIKEYFRSNKLTLNVHD